MFLPFYIEMHNFPPGSLKSLFLFFFSPFFFCGGCIIFVR